VRRVQFGGSGRRFRYILEADTGPDWALVGGIQVTAEKEED
jgi:hypothetical protein